MHHAIGAIAIVGLIAYAFGPRAAVFAVRLVLIAGAAFAAFVAYHIFMGLS